MMAFTAAVHALLVIIPLMMKMMMDFNTGFQMK